MMELKIFPMIPAPTGSLWVFALLLTILIGVLVVFGWMMYWSQHTAFKLSSEKLSITTGLYGTEFQRAELLVNEARVVDLKQEPEFDFRVRLNGIGMPGFKAGWFKLKNDSKALVFVTDKNKTVVVPTTRDHLLMVSIDNPDDFLTKLKSN